MTHTLLIFENDTIRSIAFDEKDSWEVGRPTKDNHPDIALNSPTISRHQGRFLKQDMFFFYGDHAAKNATYRNDALLKPGLGGKIKPVMLEPGDQLIFGGSSSTGHGAHAIVTLFIDRPVIEETWRIYETEPYHEFVFSYGKESKTKKDPKGTKVVQLHEGFAIIMGNKTYMNGKIDLFCH